MKLKPIDAVFSAVLLIAPLALAQDTSQQSQATGAQAPAAQPTVITGTVTSYTPNQSISVKEANGQTRQIALGANSNVSPSVKVGSKVKVSESTMNGQQMVRVEPYTGKKHARAAAGAPGQLPRTASNYPLLGLAGLLSLAAAGGVRIANKKLA